MTDAERIDYLTGQVVALKGFCIALIASHPDPELLGHAIERTGEQAVALALPTSASDALLAGLANIQTALEGTLQLRRGAQESKKGGR